MKVINFLILIGVCLGMCGCFSPARMTHYVPETTEFYELLERHPEAQDITLGSKYRLKKDLLLTGSGVKNRKCLRVFGYPGEPGSKNEYRANRTKWKHTIEGVVEEGTVFQTRLIEEFSASQPSSRASWIGVALEIMDGRHKGEMVAPAGGAFAGIGTDFAVPAPEYFEKVDN